MKRGCRDGIVKSTKDELNPPFEQLYLDSWVTVDYFRWKKRGGNIPQKIDYLIRVVYVKKSISDLVKIETTNKMKDKFDIDLEETDWDNFLKELNAINIGNPLGLSPTSPDEFDKAHIETARSLNNCIIVTWDLALLEKAPDVAWSYGKIRQIHSDT